MKTKTTDPNPLEVGARIRALRHEAGFSQSALAKLLDVTPGAVGNWEQGAVNPTIKQGVKICARFDVSLDYIFRGQMGNMEHGRGANLARLAELRHDPTGPNLRSKN